MDTATELNLQQPLSEFEHQQAFSKACMPRFELSEPEPYPRKESHEIHPVCTDSVDDLYPGIWMLSISKLS
jgi:hypothetical protein